MSDYTPTTGEIRHRVEHDWEPYGDGSFDRWLAEHDRQVKAEAWDEGAVFGVNYDLGDYEHPPEPWDNPYRQEKTDG